MNGNIQLYLYPGRHQRIQLPLLWHSFFPGRKGQIRAKFDLFPRLFHVIHGVHHLYNTILLIFKLSAIDSRLILLS